MQADRLLFLIDSNIFFMLEPYGPNRPSEPYALAAQFLRLVNDNGHRITVHDATERDIARDQNLARRQHNERALGKYARTSEVPGAPRLPVPATARDNDHVDALLAEALAADAAHYLVTRDGGLRRRVQGWKAELGSRVVTLAEAVERLDALHPEPKAPPSLVERIPCAHVQLTDPIFDSIRTDYQPDFDEWFREKCQRAGRHAFVIPGHPDRALAGLCILKDEDDHEYGLPPRRLKLCTLKVAEQFRGQRLGELLVRAALDDAIDRQRAGLCLTVFDRHQDLLNLLDDLGFQDTGEETKLGERVLFRSVVPPAGALGSVDPFEFNRLYGPRELDSNVPVHIVPIQPRWEERLFPEGKLQLDLLEGPAACGNGLRKAYLSQSSNRQVRRGDLVLFYRSTDLRRVRFVGVVEDELATANHLELGQFVGTRTVYTAEDIRRLTANGTREVNAILFRQARTVDPAWSLRDLVTNGVLVRAPQSIQGVKEEGAAWVRAQLAT